MNGYHKRKPDFAYWMRAVSDGEDERRKMLQEERWDAWRAYYRGRWRPGVVPVNLFFRMARTIVPRIYFRNPSVSVVPTKPGLENMAFARILERVDNKMLKQMKVKQQMKKMVQHAFFFGNGFGKLGFGSQFAPTPQFGITTRGVGRHGEIFEYGANIFTNMPWFRCVHPGNVVLPAGAEDLDTSRFAAEWMVRDMYDVAHDPRLNKKARNKIKDMLNDRVSGQKFQVGTGRTEHLRHRRKHKTNTQLIELLEIRDKKFGMVMLYAPYVLGDEPLAYEEDILQLHQNLPLFHLGFNLDDESVWHVPDSVVLEPHQLELNEIRTQQMKHRRLALIRILARKGSISPTEAQKLVSEDVSPVVMMSQDSNPQRDVRWTEGGGIPNGLQEAEAIVQGDARDVMGFSRNAAGEFALRKSHSPVTATEVGVVEQAGEIRLDERRDATADVLVDMTNQANVLMFQHWQGEQVMDILGPAGVPIWVQFRPEMLKQGRYEVKVDPDTSVPETREFRQSRALALYERLKTNPLLDPIQLTQFLLHELRGTQFDNMMRALPPGAGSPQAPLQPEQFGQLLAAGQAAGLPNQSVGEPT